MGEFFYQINSARQPRWPLLLHVRTLPAAEAAEILAKLGEDVSHGWKKTEWFPK